MQTSPTVSFYGMTRKLIKFTPFIMVASWSLTTKSGLIGSGTGLPFYGSHSNEADNRLTIDLLNRLAARLGDEMGIVHGGGPGLMKEGQ